MLNMDIDIAVGIYEIFAFLLPVFHNDADYIIWFSISFAFTLLLQTLQTITFSDSLERILDLRVEFAITKVFGFYKKLKMAVIERLLLLALLSSDIPRLSLFRFCPLCKSESIFLHTYHQNFLRKK